LKNGEQKDKLINDYLKRLKAIKCKYFKPGENSSCPFGNSCFYSHLNSDGTPYIIPRRQKIIKDDGTEMLDYDLKLSDLIDI
jgi:hypothetical protein